MNLSKSSFLALAAIGWVDGSLQRVEAIGLLRAARAAGLSDRDVAEVEEATRKRVSLEGIDLAALTEWERVLTYALGAWFAQVDGVVSTSEATMLGALGDALGLADGVRKRAATAANDVACLPEGGRPEKYDFDRLVGRLRERMPQLRQGLT